GVPEGWRGLAGPPMPFGAVAWAWFFFRSADIETARRMLQGIAGLADPEGTAPLASGDRLAALRYLAAIVIVFLLPNSQTLIEGSRQRSGDTAPEIVPLAWRGPLGWGIAMGALAALSVATFSQVSEFLYWRF